MIFWTFLTYVVVVDLAYRIVLPFKKNFVNSVSVSKQN